MRTVRARVVRASRHLRRSLFPVGLVVVVSAGSVALRLNSPPLIEPQSAFDDSMYAYQGWMLATDRWLGPYSFATLTKGPGYPLYIAAVYRLDLPLKLSEHVLHLLAVGVLSLAVARVTRTPGWGSSSTAPLRSTPRTSDGRRPCSAATATTAASR